MKKFIFYTAMLFLLGIIAYKLFFYFDKKSEQKAILKNEAITRLSEDELSKIEEGDFILRRGFGFFSDYISKELNSGPIDVTHAGIIIKRNDSLYVVHSLSSDVTDVDGLQLQPLKEFLKYSFPNKEQDKVEIQTFFLFHPATGIFVEFVLVIFHTIEI